MGTNTRLVVDMFKTVLEAGLLRKVRETGNAKELCRPKAKRAVIRLRVADGNIRAM